jgi:diguanylate cyclase (GGDEF)-like protein
MATPSNGLVLLGALLLAWSLVPTFRVLLLLTPGRARDLWMVLFALILAFMAGDLLYIGLCLRGVLSGADLLVPVILLLGGGFVKIVARLSLEAVDSVRRLRELEIENATDSLMGIYNRRHFDRRIREECARAARYGLPLSLLMVDVDHFKSINDTRGHQAGDAVLAGLGALLSHEMRICDVVARYGGEEIAILATNTDIDGARVFAERIRARVEAAEFLPGGLRCTVSIGVAAFHGPPDGPGELVAAADAALYRAKESGRNRVEVEAKGGVSNASGSRTDPRRR